jgi:hypothetical protein
VKANDNQSCKPGEIFLGPSDAGHIGDYSTRIMVRIEYAEDIFRLYVDARELHNFLIQESLELGELHESIRKNTLVCNDLRKLVAARIGEGQCADEVFIGTFTNELNAKYVFPEFDSIRGGNLSGEELMQFYGEDGKLGPKEVVQLFEYFADRREFVVYLRGLEKRNREESVQFEQRDAFYKKIKVFEGG